MKAPRPVLRRLAAVRHGLSDAAAVVRSEISACRPRSDSRTRISDRNRIFLLVSNVYPAILGTMIWELISHVPSNFVSWVATLLIVAHFSLDLLYLKVNLDDDRDSFRYGWLLFFIDVAIVSLIRLAFGTISGLSRASDAVVNPITAFAMIYLLYVLWEYIYYWFNGTDKPSPASSVKHYWYLAGWFILCAGAYALCLGARLPGWGSTFAVTAFLAGIAAACAELYWSVFLAIKDVQKGATEVREEVNDDRLPDPQHRARGSRVYADSDS